MAKRTVLVQLDSFSRKIHLDEEGESINGLDLLLREVRKSYKERIQPDDCLTLQMKESDFDGIFVDFFEGEIPDKSVFRVIVEKSQVCRLLCL